MPSRYFSDREQGPSEKVRLEVDSAAWGGLVALIEGFIANGGFGIDFPEECLDGRGPTGTNWHNLGLAIRAEIPELAWPLRADSIPPTIAIMDLLEFCHDHVAKAIQGSYHKSPDHYHLGFDRDAGKLQFRDQVSRIFSRNKLAFEFRKDGTVARLAAPAFQEILVGQVFNTSDGKLNRVLESARTKFLDPDSAVRREALKELWDAWERVKTLEGGIDKKASTQAILDKAAAEPKFRKLIDDEAVCLTYVGNHFHIRHSETSQIEIQSEDQVDYLFYRLFALIWLVLRAR